jgi:glycosyltransferase involved in cell wall biosynthesis
MVQDLDVLFCTDYLPPSDGGVEHVVDQLARRVAARDRSVGIFTLSTSEESLDLADHPDISLITAPRVDLTDYIGLQSAVSPRGLRSFKHVLDEYDPNIVHVHNRFFFSPYLGLLYSRFYDYSLVSSLHLGTLDHLNGVGGSLASIFQSTFSKRLITQSRAVICVSDAVAEVASSLGAETERVYVVPNAVDLERFDADPETFDKTLVYIGRLVSNNGPSDLVQAVPDIVNAHPETSVHIVGSGTLQASLQKSIASLGIEDTVSVHGFVDDITEIYEIADVFCRPSYSEGLPLTLIEAMATYTVPVVTPVAGSKEVITEGKNGYFVDIKSPDSIADIINLLFDDPDRIRTMAGNAREHVESNHSWSKRTEDILRIYEEYRNE